MTKETRAHGPARRRLEPLSFGVALGHRLRQVREDRGQTAADVASTARGLGLAWDRSTVARIELGQRQVTAAELLLMTLVYDVPLRDLLPTERVRFTDVVTADPDGLAEVLHESAPSFAEWQVEGLVDAVVEAFDRIRPAVAAAQTRMPGAGALAVMAAAKHGSDEPTRKAAVRLAATVEEVAVAALQLWKRGLAAERDARVNAMGSCDRRTRQARRGHVTRVLLNELEPAVAAVRTGSTRHEGDVDGER